MGRSTIDKSTPSAIDLDTILNGYAGYIKTECFSYEDSGFVTKENHVHQHANQTNCDGLAANLSNETNMGAYQSAVSNNDRPLTGNEGDWHLPDTNGPSAESLLRSALQGKGYTKGLTSLSSVKEEEEEIRRALYASDPVSRL
jgi:hypothetical protein